MEDNPDFLDELMAEGMTENPQFGSYVDAALRRRALLRSFGRRREALGISQRTLAARMRTQQPAITRLERGESDPKLSTLERYAAALGFDLDVTLVARLTGASTKSGSILDVPLARLSRRERGRPTRHVANARGGRSCGDLVDAPLTNQSHETGDIISQTAAEEQSVSFRAATGATAK